MMSDSDLVLVSDISGFVASHVAKTLHQSGFRVRGTVPNQTTWSRIKWFYQGNTDLENIPMEMVETSIHDEASWTNAVRDCSYVVHTICPYAHAQDDDPESVLQLTLQNMMFVLRACRRAGTVKRLVITSSTAAIEYNDNTRHSEYTEDDWTDVTSQDTTLYGRVMTVTERAAWSYIHTLPDPEQIDMVVINSGFPLGPALINSPSPNFTLIKNLMEGRINMVPRIYFPVSDVRDLAQAHQQALTLDEAKDHRHIVITKTVGLLEVARILHESFLVLGYNVPCKQLPDLLVKALGLLGTSSMRTVRGQVGRCSNFSRRRMIDVLGLRSRPVETSLVEMVHSLIDHGVISQPLNNDRAGNGQGKSSVVV